MIKYLAWVYSETPMKYYEKSLMITKIEESHRINFTPT